MQRRGTLARLLPAAALLAWAGAAGCGGPDADTRRVRVAPPIPVPTANGPRDVAVLSIKGFGDVRIELLDDLAPRTVDNFVELAERDFYDGTTFHRIIPGFAIQGGDPLTKDRDPRNDGRGGPGYSIDDEFSNVSHLRGVVSMANKGRPSSAGSQFFVTLDESRSLDGKYTVFGYVVGGMDVVDRIAEVERDLYGRRGPRDRPLENIVIEDVRIEREAGGRRLIAEEEEPESLSGGLEFSASKQRDRERADAVPPEAGGEALPASLDPDA